MDTRTTTATRPAGFTKTDAATTEATDLFEKSAFAKQAFGPAVHEHYTHFYRTEAQAFDRAVTDWERRRYFERI